MRYEGDDVSAVPGMVDRSFVSLIGAEAGVLVVFLRNSSTISRAQSRAGGQYERRRYPNSICLGHAGRSVR
jgi:hypothetical protein